MKNSGIARLRLAATGVALVAIAAVLAPSAPGIARYARSFAPGRRTQRSALEVLRGEHLAFLVTDRIVSQIVVESAENNPLLGKREGFLIAKASLYYGMDLSKLTEADLVRTNDVLRVRLPEPEELDFSVDLESMRFISKRSGLMVIADWITNTDQKDALLSQFKTAALQHMKDERLIPEKERILLRLSGLGEMLSEYLGTQVVFE